MHNLAGRRDRFAMFPAFWIPLLRNLGEFKTALALLSYANPEGHATVSERTIAQAAGISQTTAHRAIARLVDRGLLHARKVGQRGATVYFAKVSESLYDSHHQSSESFPWSQRVSQRDSVVIQNVRGRDSLSETDLTETFKRPTELPQSLKQLGAKLARRTA